ncbi:MAG: hypothetical protein U0802_05525 [Candidatus Binatia bacterium]
MTLLATYATGVAAVMVVAVAWVAVQGAWRRVFPERLIDVDAMVGRLGCTGRCERDALAPCPQRGRDGTCRHKEEP